MLYPAIRESERGFTLLEVMISLGILAVIFTLIYGTFDAVHRGAEQLEEEAEIYRLARYGIYHMSNNLSMLLRPSPSGSASTPIFLGEDHERLIEGERFPNDSLEFDAVSHGQTMLDAPESDQVRIKYALEDDILIQEMLLSNGKTIKYEIGGPFQGLNFRYFDSKNKSWEDEWNASVNNPPLAVEIEFFLQQKSRKLHRFKTRVDISM